LLLLNFGNELPKQTGRERPHVDRFTRFDFELLRLLVARAVEHRRGDANCQGPMLRVRLVGFKHALEDIERGMLERQEPLGRLLLHVRRRATVITADSASWLLALHPFTEALDAALTWAAESGGEIYRRDQPGAEPGLYKAAW
jgi:hypothetical protein